MNWQRIDDWLRPASFITFLVVFIVGFLSLLVWAATGILSIPIIGPIFQSWILFAIAYTIVSLFLDNWGNRGWREREDAYRKAQDSDGPSTPGT